MWQDYIHVAIQNLHPGANLVSDYTWIMDVDTGQPFMQSWNEARLGPLDLPAIQTEAERLLAKASEPPIPAAISDRQFAHGLALAGMITEAEALNWVRTGELPQAIENFVPTLPPEQQFAARMLLSGATEFRRDNPLVATFGQLTGMDDAALDHFWRTCAQL